MVQLTKIAPKDQEDTLGCYWIMMHECARAAETDNDPVLRIQVEGFFRLWNRITGDEAKPSWLK